MKKHMFNKVAAATITATLLFGSAIVLPAQAVYAAQSAEVTWGVNMRKEPSTSSSVVRMLKKGEHISIVEAVGSSWYKISDASGKIGYISSSSKYTKLGSVTSTPESETDPSDSSAAVPALTAVVNKSVSFRTGPSTSAERIRYLKTGEVVQVVGKANSSWYEVVDGSGKKGFVTTLSPYMTVGSGSNAGTGSGSGSSSNSSEKPQTSTNASVEKVIAAGMKYLGTPYEYGSNRNTTTTFDCSDFVRQAFKDALGITLPASSQQQGNYVKNKGNVTTSISKLKRGDLMFFMSYKGSSASLYSGVNKSSQKITHVGIYLGDGKVLHTYSKESGGVRTNSISGTHWEHRFLFGGSAL